MRKSSTSGAPPAKRARRVSAPASVAPAAAGRGLRPRAGNKPPAVNPDADAQPATHPPPAPPAATSPSSRGAVTVTMELDIEVVEERAKPQLDAAKAATRAANAAHEAAANAGVALHALMKTTRSGNAEGEAKIEEGVHGFQAAAAEAREAAKAKSKADAALLAKLPKGMMDMLKNMKATCVEFKTTVDEAGVATAHVQASIDDMVDRLFFKRFFLGVIDDDSGVKFTIDTDMLWALLGIPEFTGAEGQLKLLTGKTVAFFNPNTMDLVHFTVVKTRGKRSMLVAGDPAAARALAAAWGLPNLGGNVIAFAWDPDANGGKGAVPPRPDNPWDVTQTFAAFLALESSGECLYGDDQVWLDSKVGLGLVQKIIFTNANLCMPGNLRIELTEYLRQGHVTHRTRHLLTHGAWAKAQKDKVKALGAVDEIGSFVFRFVDDLCFKHHPKTVDRVNYRASEHHTDESKFNEFFGNPEVEDDPRIRTGDAIMLVHYDTERIDGETTLVWGVLREMDVWYPKEDVEKAMWDAMARRGL